MWAPGRVQSQQDGRGKGALYVCRGMFRGVYYLLLSSVKIFKGKTWWDHCSRQRMSSRRSRTVGQQRVWLHLLSIHKLTGTVYSLEIVRNMVQLFHKKHCHVKAKHAQILLDWDLDCERRVEWSNGQKERKIKEVEETTTGIREIYNCVVSITELIWKSDLNYLALGRLRKANFKQSSLTFRIISWWLYMNNWLNRSNFIGPHPFIKTIN